MKKRKHANGGELTPEEEKAFRSWYKQMSNNKGLDSNPDSKLHYYDYRSYWKDVASKTAEQQDHFPDTYKLPGHPTFSKESKYSNEKTPGGNWRMDLGNDVFEHSDYTIGYSDRTNKYLGEEGGIAVYKGGQVLNSVTVKGKKIKKKRYNLGGLQQYQAPQSQGPQDDQIDQTGTQIAGAIGPQWAALAQVGVSASKEAKGSGLNYKNNLIGTGLDPFSWAKDNDNAGDWAQSTLLGPTNWGQKARKQKRRAENMVNQQNAAINQSLIQNSAVQPMMNKGGNLVSKKLKVLNGGSLNPISPDAVEVNATNPGLVDSVELNDAFVDNNEIIDNKDRVFSDILTTPSGRSIAKEAKGLERMKSTNSRFSNSNSRIDSKLNELFSYQESLKSDVPKPTLGYNAMQGKLASENEGDDTFFNNAYKMLDAQKVRSKLGVNKEGKPAFKKGGVKPKPVYDKGGPFSGWEDPNSIREDGFAGVGPEKQGFNWGQAANSAATVAPNILNAYLQKKLKGPASPTLETDIRLDRIDPAAQLAENTRQAGAANSLILKNTAQGANITSSIGSVMAKKLASNNQVYGQTQAINADIQGREAMINQGVRARNAMSTNRFKDDLVGFANKKLQLTSENVANLSGKVQANRREKNAMDRDRMALEVMKKQYEDSGVYDRNIESQLEAYFSKKGYKSKGGTLSRMSRKLYKNC